MLNLKQPCQFKDKINYQNYHSSFGGLVFGPPAFPILLTLVSNTCTNNPVIDHIIV